jgi:hypothetical protein
MTFVRFKTTFKLVDFPFQLALNNLVSRGKHNMRWRRVDSRKVAHVVMLSWLNDVSKMIHGPNTVATVITTPEKWM